MIIESAEEFELLKQTLATGDSFWVPVYSDVFQHYIQNQLCFVYIYSIHYNLDYVIPFRHNDCINLNTERLTEVTSSGDIFVLDKKRFCFYYSKQCIDADLVCWWQTQSPLAVDDINTTTHDVWLRWWHNETSINNWLPITKHIERCRQLRDKFLESYRTFTITDDFRRYDTLAIDNFYSIEQSGLYINASVLHEKYKNAAITSQLVFTEYNLYTTTGRPSNKFGGINYAALPKEDGTRSAFISRFHRGILVEFDFDAFHLRLIAKLIDYDLPQGISIHEYFGRQYFNTTALTTEQYEESKQITFRLLYGGIDDDFAEIPFFREVRNYTRQLWHQFKHDGVVYTPVMNRPMYKKSLTNMNANKLFNYILQSYESEHNLLVIANVQDILQNYNSKLILYTYDSFLFDLDLNDGGRLVTAIAEAITTQNTFPVKIKVGSDYHNMKIINRSIM
jgi:hypothetical protein